MTYPDEHIVDQIRMKNENTLRQVYVTHFPMVLHLILFNSGTEQEAKDIYQEAVIAFYEKVQQKNFELTCRIKTYLYAVSRRLWLKRLAEKKVFVVRIDDSETFSGVEDEMIEIDAKEKEFSNMDNALAGLGEPCRTILEDFYLRGLSMEKIHEKFGYTNVDNAKNQKYKCLQRLKKLFFSSNKEV